MKHNCPHFFFNDTATTEIYTLSLHDALPIFARAVQRQVNEGTIEKFTVDVSRPGVLSQFLFAFLPIILLVVLFFWLMNSMQDRKSTRLNSSHANISYAVFCLKKKKKQPPNGL